MARIAIIDIGTVSVRLAVADVEDGHVVRCIKRTRICNLGEDTDKAGILCQAAQNRVMTCVFMYLDLAECAGAEVCVCTLTSAARDAKNSDEFIAMLTNAGLKPQIISGEVEASLSFIGVAQDFPGKNIAIADCGGGSTEVAVGRYSQEEGLDLSWVHSFDIGCRRITERYLHSKNPVNMPDLMVAHNEINQGFTSLIPWQRQAQAPLIPKPETLICVGGTATSLVSINEKMVKYDPKIVHLHELTIESVMETEKNLAQLNVLQLQNLVGLQPERAGVIVGGAAIISELMKVTKFNSLTVSESDLLFGLAIVADCTYTNKKSVLKWSPCLREMR